MVSDYYWSYNISVHHKQLHELGFSALTNSKIKLKKYKIILTKLKPVVLNFVNVFIIWNILEHSECQGAKNACGNYAYSSMNCSFPVLFIEHCTFTVEHYFRHPAYIDFHNASSRLSISN
jgi:hypothetical protein